MNIYPKIWVQKYVYTSRWKIWVHPKNPLNVVYDVNGDLFIVFHMDNGVHKLQITVHHVTVCGELGCHGNGGNGGKMAAPM